MNRIDNRFLKDFQLTIKYFQSISSVPRILESYGRECFKFTENFL